LVEVGGAVVAGQCGGEGAAAGGIGCAAPATAELKDATAKKTAATEQCSDADRVETLAQAEKDKRQSTAR